MTKLFISQPMRGLSEKEIFRRRVELKTKAQFILDDEVEVLDSYFVNAPLSSAPLWYLGRSLQILSSADVAMFAKDYQDTRGCKIEYDCALAYSIPTIIEE
jgi:hypothetical protein